MTKLFIQFLTMVLFGAHNTLQSMEPVGQKEKWLILGAGTVHDTSKWDKYTSERGVEWIGFNDGSMMGPLTKAIVGNFDKPEDLDKLEDGAYDKIFFDWSTSKFMHDWDKNLIGVLYKKLKENGELLIQEGGCPFKRKPGNYTFEKEELVLINLSYENYVAYCEANRSSDTFGCYSCPEPAWERLKWSERQRCEFVKRYNNEYMRPHNIKLLQSIFGNNVQLKVNRLHPSYLDHFIQTYYRAVKSSHMTVALGNEIDKAPFCDKVGDYTIKGRFYFPAHAKKEKDMTLCFVDAEGNIYYVRFPEYDTTYRTLLAFINKVLGKEYTKLYLMAQYGSVPLRGITLINNLDKMPEMSHELLGLDGEYGKDIPWHENRFSVDDVPVIEHGITRDQLPEDVFVWDPAPEVAATPVIEEVLQQKRTLWERLLAACCCYKKSKVTLV